MNKHNKTVSVQLTKAQRKLRYLAGHENTSDKNTLIKMTEEEPTPSISQDEQDGTANETITTILSDTEDKPPGYDIVRNKREAAADDELEEFSDPPPSYQYPQHLLMDLQN